MHARTPVCSNVYFQIDKTNIEISECRRCSVSHSAHCTWIIYFRSLFSNGKSDFAFEHFSHEFTLSHRVCGADELFSMQDESSNTQNGII